MNMNHVGTLIHEISQSPVMLFYFAPFITSASCPKNLNSKPGRPHRKRIHGAFKQLAKRVDIVESQVSMKAQQNISLFEVVTGNNCSRVA